MTLPLSTTCSTESPGRGVRRREGERGRGGGRGRGEGEGEGEGGGGEGERVEGGGERKGVEVSPHERCTGQH